MAKNTLKQGDTITIKDVKRGHSQKGEWCFLHAENCDKLTLWVENNDFKGEAGDKAEIIEIKSCALKINKVGDKYYNNYNLSVILRSIDSLNSADAFIEPDDKNDFDDGDFI